MTKKALIVDDSRLACKVMAKMLDTFDFKSVEVYSAEEALEHLKFNKPDVIFLDHTMSGMDGLEVMKVIKSNPDTSQIPVMMYTAKEGDYYVGQAIALGAADVLPKGLEKKQLFNALKKIGLLSSKSVISSKSVTAANTQTFDDKTEKSTLTQEENSKLEPVSISSPETNENEKPGEQAASQWQLFWKQRLEPYLEKQKNHQQKQFEYNTKEQTRKLIRDMHVTLEQFEHALVLRMESHADFVSATEEVARGGRRKWLAIIGGLILISQLGIFWHLWKTNQINSALLKTQQESIQLNRLQLEFIDKSLLQTKNQFNDLKSNFINTDKSESQNSAAIQSQQPTVSLHNQQGELIANLITLDPELGIYLGTSDNGYQFNVNTQGVVGSELDNRYYLTPDCSGDNYVMAEKSTIYKDINNDIWYVDRLAEPITVNAFSTRTLEDECIPISGEVMDLYYLQKNQAYETGIEEAQTFKLTFLQ